MNDHHDGQPPRQSRRQMMIAGLVVTIVGGFLALVFLLATLLAANPCGTFGDACDDYGTTSNAFVVMLVLTLLGNGGIRRRPRALGQRSSCARLTGADGDGADRPFRHVDYVPDGGQRDAHASVRAI